MPHFRHAMDRGFNSTNKATIPNTLSFQKQLQSSSVPHFNNQFVSNTSKHYAKGLKDQPT